MSKMPKKLKDIVGKVYPDNSLFYVDLEKVKGLVHEKGQFPVIDRMDIDASVITVTAKDKPTIAVLGKGVIFDTGGYDLKHQMLDMHGDKAGALATLTVGLTNKFRTVKFLAGFARNEMTIVPGEIVTTITGKRIEVQNTDAEGRLVLADLIEHVQRTYPSVKHIITIATLTGSKMQALGKNYGALFSENEKLRRKVFDNEDKLKLHPLPIPNDKLCKPYSSKRNGVDIPNVDGSRDLGHVKAYKFLKYFVKKGIQLHHIDMAGCELDENRNPTGYGVEQIEFLLRNLK